MTIDDEFITTEEVAEHLKVSTKTLYNWRQSKENPFPEPLSMGGHNRYSKQDINNWLSKFKGAA